MTTVRLRGGGQVNEGIQTLRGAPQMGPSVSPGEDRDELAHADILVPSERVLRGEIDYIFRLSLELLGELLH